MSKAIKVIALIDRSGCFVGVPAILGAGGVEKVIEVELNADERRQFDSSVAHVKELCGVADKFL